MRKASDKGCVVEIDKQRRNPKYRGCGFTDAELAAAEFSRKHKDTDSGSCRDITHHQRKRQYQKRSRSTDNNRERGRSTSCCVERNDKFDAEGRNRRDRHDSSSSIESADSVISDSRPPVDPINPLEAAYDRHCYYRREKKPRKIQTEKPWLHDEFERRSESPNTDRTEGPMWDTRLGSWRARAGGRFLPPEEKSPNAEREPSPARYKFSYKPNSERKSRRRESRSPSGGRRRGSPVYELD